MKRNHRRRSSHSKRTVRLCAIPGCGERAQHSVPFCVNHQPLLPFEADNPKSVSLALVERGKKSA